LPSATLTGMAQTFDELVDEADAVSVDGWEFSWLDGRATEERPSWGYSRLLADRMAEATAALDIQTGGGEVLAGLPRLAELTVATESWPPNIARARHHLGPRGVTVVADDDEPPLPFDDASFDLVVSRHPVTAWWAEIARVLRPGGRYFSQQVGMGSVHEVSEYFLGPFTPDPGRSPELAGKNAEAHGLVVTDLRHESLRTVFHDVGAVVYFLRKVIWIVPGFTVEKYRAKLAELHDRIQSDGPFVAHTERFLIEARKP